MKKIKIGYYHYPLDEVIKGLKKAIESFEKWPKHISMEVHWNSPCGIM